MKIGIIVQARMSSRRLPGKSLRLVHGIPLLGMLIRRLQKARLCDDIVIATSDDPSDSPIERYCKAESIPYHRGSLHDVAARLLTAAQVFGFDTFVRICGDSPLIDYRLVDHAMELFQFDMPDMVTNVLTRTFPKGQSVEVIRTTSLHRCIPLMTTAEHHEHVTPWFYENRSDLNITSFESGGHYGEIQLSVDKENDLQRVERLVALNGVDPVESTWLDLVSALRKMESMQC